MNSTNLDEQWKKFCSLTYEEIDKMWKQSTSTAANIVKKAVRESLATNVPNSTKPIRGYGGKMTDAVGIKRGTTNTYIHARGNGRGGSFIAKFFEDGSLTPRQTKKGQDRGTIKGYHFFEQGVNGSIEAARAELEFQLEKTINNINKMNNG